MAYRDELCASNPEVVEPDVLLQSDRKKTGIMSIEILKKTICIGLNFW